MNTCVVGLSFGDEAKGKIVDILAPEHDYVVRYNGGPNAGHTVVVGDQTYKFHHIPSGCVANIPGIMAGGMVINPVSLCEELDDSPGTVYTNLSISHEAHAIMPWHLHADIKKGGKIGTTGRGVGPAYADKMHRWNAIRMGDLLPKLEDERLQRFFAADEALHGSGLWKKYHDAAKKLDPLICDTGQILRDAVKKGKNILFESANGIHLDIDHGTFPYVTSSGVGPAAIPQACGLPNLHLDRIIGVIKCYATRVGEGPFPSEMVSEEDAAFLKSCSSQREWLKYTNHPYPKKAHAVSCEIREKGKEYGTTTGRPRRIGWFDINMTRRAIALTGATEIALMHVDTIAKLDTAADLFVLDNDELVDLPQWKDVHDVKFKAFVGYITGALGVPINLVSFGPGRSETVIFDK